MYNVINDKQKGNTTMKNIIREHVENYVVSNSEKGRRITFQAMTEQLAYAEKGEFSLKNFESYGPERYEARYYRTGGDCVVCRFYEQGDALYLECLEYIDYRELLGL